MTTMPVRSLEQRRAALETAQHIRTMRSQRKALWRRGEPSEAIADFLDLLESTPEWAVTWKVWDVLLTLPKVGAVKAFGIMRKVGMSHVKTLGGVSPRQRAELVESFAERETLKRRRMRMHYSPGDSYCECGAAKTPPSLRCRRCYNRDRAEELAPKLICPDCGGRKLPQSQMCGACWEASPRNPFRRA